MYANDLLGRLTTNLHWEPVTNPTTDSEHPLEITDITTAQWKNNSYRGDIYNKNSRQNILRYLFCKINKCENANIDINNDLHGTTLLIYEVNILCCKQPSLH